MVTCLTVQCGFCSNRKHACQRISEKLPIPRGWGYVHSNEGCIIVACEECINKRRKYPGEV